MFKEAGGDKDQDSGFQLIILGDRETAPESGEGHQ